MAELVTTEKPKGHESKGFVGFNLDLILSFDYTEVNGTEGRLEVDFAAPDPSQPGGFYRKTYYGKEAKAMAKYLLDLSREIRVPNKT